jgi:ERCC4-type nuclease
MHFVSLYITYIFRVEISSLTTEPAISSQTIMTAAAQRLLPILLILLATSLSQGFNHLTQRVGGGVKVCRTSSNDQTTRLLMSYDVENETKRQLYNIKNSSWKSNEWNWGYARGMSNWCCCCIDALLSSKEHDNELQVQDMIVLPSADADGPTRPIAKN